MNIQAHHILSAFAVTSTMGLLACTSDTTGDAVPADQGDEEVTSALNTYSAATPHKVDITVVYEGRIGATDDQHNSSWDKMFGPTSGKDFGNYAAFDVLYTYTYTNSAGVATTATTIVACSYSGVCNTGYFAGKITSLKVRPFINETATNVPANTVGFYNFEGYNVSTTKCTAATTASCTTYANPVGHDVNMWAKSNTFARNGCTSEVQPVRACSGIPYRLYDGASAITTYPLSLTIGNPTTATIGTPAAALRHTYAVGGNGTSCTSNTNVNCWIRSGASGDSAGNEGFAAVFRFKPAKKSSYSATTVPIGQAPFVTMAGLALMP